MLPISEIQSLLAKVARGETLTDVERARVLLAGQAQVGGESFQLTGDSAPEKKLSRDRLEGWERVYQTAHRQLRRWWNEGLVKGDPCPLDDPAAMPGWWNRNMKHSVPSKILAAANAAKPPPSPPVVGAPAAAGEADPVSPGYKVDLATLGLDEGEEINQARRLVSAAYERLEAAYKTGGDANIDAAQKRWTNAQESLRKAMAQDEERRRKRGDLVPRLEIQKDYANFAEMLRGMHASMERRVLELCPSLTPEAKESVARAIRAARASEIRFLRNLDKVNNLNDLGELFAA